MKPRPPEAEGKRFAAGSSLLPTLLIVGGETEEPDPVATPEISALRDLAGDLGVSDQIRFIGRKQPDELHLWYSAADVAVTTPWYEPFGLTPLEAMACAVPVIGSRVGGIAFTIADGETGYLVPPHDAQALCDRLDRLLGEPALRMRMGQAGRTRMLRGFTWDLVATRTAALYDGLLSGPLASPDPHPSPSAAGRFAAAGRPGGVSL